MQALVNIVEALLDDNQRDKLTQILDQHRTSSPPKENPLATPTRSSMTSLWRTSSSSSSGYSNPPSTRRNRHRQKSYAATRHHQALKLPLGIPRGPCQEKGWHPDILHGLHSAAIHKDSYPLPRIDDSLDFLGLAKYFSSVDLVCG